MSEEQKKQRFQRRAMKFRDYVAETFPNDDNSSKD